MGIFLRNSNGTFGSQQTFSTGNSRQPYAIVVDDLNRNGRLDVVVANYCKNNCYVFLGFSNGSLTTQTTYSTGNASNPRSVAVAGYHLDIILVNFNDNNLDVFLGYGNESFGSQIRFSTGSYSYPLASAINDFNIDNRLDIFVNNSYQSNLGILLNIC